MLASNPFEDIVGTDFTCSKEPPLPPENCPGQSFTDGGPQLDQDIGEWYCPLCLCVFRLADDDQDYLFDDDEDEEDAFDNDEEFIPEAEKLIQRTPEEDKRIDRIIAADALSEAISNINLRLAIYIDTNKYAIVDRLRELEWAEEPYFRENTNIKPKILAIALHQSNFRLNANDFKTLNVNQRRVESCVRALGLLQPKPGSEDPMIVNIRFVGNALDIPEAVVEIIIEQYEELGRPPNREEDWRTRAAAWIYLKTKHIKSIKVTKAQFKRIPGVLKNAFDRAVSSYEVVLEKGNKSVEGVAALDD